MVLVIRAVEVPRLYEPSFADSSPVASTLKTRWFTIGYVEALSTCILAWMVWYLVIKVGSWRFGK